MTRQVLLVEDEAPLREMLKFALSKEDCEITEAADASEGLARLRERRPDIILLDWMLPGMSGLEFLRHIRREVALRDIPVIMLTARGEEDDRVRGLQAGADDYLGKPFSTRELKARMEAVLRRASPAREGLLVAGGLRLDPAGHELTADGQPVSLGPTEFRLLRFFMSHPDRVYSREQLLDNVWGQNVYVEERTVDVHIRRLRKALAPSGHDGCIQTVRTVGYRFSTQAGS
ncbi:MAG TPA: phosphate regulon transcriptional regulatory protein PhoB [Gammaproteobacteria bacterium]|nr:phosphate regulon transcriptional regulatory protein PhoB [Gammaproteobacteria bacterium]